MSITHDELRAERRNVVEWLLMVALLLLAALWAYRAVDRERVRSQLLIEVDLDPITVQMEDPFPCSTNTLYRIAYQNLGAICADQ